MNNSTELGAAEQILRARAGLMGPHDSPLTVRKTEAEGGCGVIGIASSVPIEGRHLLQSLVQMRNRGNGKGGGAALAGLEPGEFGVTSQQLTNCYLLAVAYLAEAVRSEVERERIEPMFEVEHVHPLPLLATLDPPAPKAVAYFVRPKRSRLDEFADLGKLRGIDRETLEDEFVYQNSFKLNSSYYASLGEKRAFVLSHGKDLLALKLVGYGEDVFHVYGLEALRAHVWIGHHRYPTKGRVWHPGGAHPFVGLHEALVHNGDFANYASVSAYLAQNNIRPLFLTDTEVSVLMFDLLHRTFGYPLEYVIEALAPTTERDFAQLPEHKREIYRWIQAAHMHGSPDGPWFFLLAQTAQNGSSGREARLIGITDTSMLRPQVFALQQGAAGQPSIGFAASEKQAIDAALESLAGADPRFGTRADLVWNARGGSHTDGGAFVFSVVRGPGEQAELRCRDKFGRQIKIEDPTVPYRASAGILPKDRSPLELAGTTDSLFRAATRALPGWSYRQLQAFLGGLTGSSLALGAQLELLSLLLDRRYPTGSMRRSSVNSFIDQALVDWNRSVAESPGIDFVQYEKGAPLPQPVGEGQAVVIRANGFAAQGKESLALMIRALVDRGFRRIIVMGASGQRFIGSGLGATTERVVIEV
ncbi:MAG: glutamate synthase, partial [Anaerolineales bacterium]